MAWCYLGSTIHTESVREKLQIKLVNKDCRAEVAGHSSSYMQKESSFRLNIV